MRVAVISDIHANLPALEATAEAIGRESPDEIWCLGDLVGYGAQPNECCAWAQANARECLVGNHDLGVLGTLELDDFAGDAAVAARWTRTVLDADAHAYLSALGPSGLAHGVGLYHGSPRDPVWEYVLSPLQAELSFDVQPQRISVVGHTHVALAFHRFDGEGATGETRHEGDQLDISAGRWLLNPGSVGQPRDGDSRAAWLELDTEAWTACWRRAEYDIDGAAWAIRAARLPDALAERLSFGQ
jgi:diadenosine tetraphosphatase ApaH/serine/threonine PP2A family protein phosphatase